MLTIHGVSGSPFVRKVQTALNEKGVAFEQIPVMPLGPRDEFMKISPLGKIPVLQDGDFTIPDSSVILAYIERTHPKPALYPADPQDFARALFCEEYADTKLVESAGPVFFNRVVKAQLMKQESDEKLVKQKLTQDLPPIFDYLESQVRDGEWLVGSGFSIADIAVASPFVNLQHAGESVDAGRWPKLAAYLERVHGRPSMKGLIEQEKAQFGAA